MKNHTVITQPIFDLVIVLEHIFTRLQVQVDPFFLSFPYPIKA